MRFWRWLARKIRRTISCEHFSTRTFPEHVEHLLSSVVVRILRSHCSILLLFFLGDGSNMVAFRAQLDGTWQTKFQRSLRYRVTGLRPSGFPNLLFSLFLPPFSSLSPFFPFFFFPLFSHFYLSFFLKKFFPLIFQHVSFTFSHLPLFPVFLAKATCLHVTPLSAMCPTRHRIMRRTRHVVKEDFDCFSAFSAHSKRVLIRRTAKNGRFLIFT